MNNEEELERLSFEAARTFAQQFNDLKRSDVELAIALNKTPGIHATFQKAAAGWTDNPEAVPFLLAIATRYAQEYYRLKYGKGGEPTGRI